MQNNNDRTPNSHRFLLALFLFQQTERAIPKVTGEKRQEPYLDRGVHRRRCSGCWPPAPPSGGKSRSGCLHGRRFHPSRPRPPASSPPTRKSTTPFAPSSSCITTPPPLPPSAYWATLLDAYLVVEGKGWEASAMVVMAQVRRPGRRPARTALPLHPLAFSLGAAGLSGRRLRRAERRAPADPPSPHQQWEPEVEASPCRALTAGTGPRGGGYGGAEEDADGLWRRCQQRQPNGWGRRRTT